MKRSALFKKIMIRATAAFLLCSPAFADYNSYGIPDSTEIRKTLVDTWFVSSTDSLRGKNPEIHSSSTGVKFQVRAEEGVDDFRIIVSPQSESTVDFINGEERTTLKVNVYPEGAQGSWVLYKNKTTGKAEKILWYMNADAEVYMQFRPYSSKTYIDVVVYQNYLVKSMPLGIPFERLYDISFADIQRMTQKSVPWNKLTVVPGMYHPSLQMAGVIRKNISRFHYLEDACYNEKGRLFSILENKPYYEVYEADDDGEELPEDALTVNGAGFLKWIVDGIIESYMADGTEINQLKYQTVEYNPVGALGVLSQAYDLSFSLDWCRNLAVACFSARSQRNYNLTDSGVDVNFNHFVGVTGYLPDTGYDVNMLKSILYIQAVTEPSWFYLAAIKQHSTVKHEEFVFNDCAIFFPYFDDTGKFNCVVFEQGREISLADFISRHENSFIHLERIKATDDFYPQ